MITWLKGKKTFIICIASLLYAAYGFFYLKTLTPFEAEQITQTALIGIGLRLGIKNS